MNPIRILVAAIVGGIVVFCWGAAAHIVLQIDKMAVRGIPAETSVLPHLKEALPERGFYSFPWVDMNDKSPAAQDAWAARYRSGPRGVVIYDPAGGEPMSAAMLGTEFASNLFAALLLAIVLSKVHGGWATRALLAVLLGVFAWVSIDVSYWNWYRFPGDFAFVSLIEQVAGWLLGGLAIALILGRGTSAPQPVPVE